MFESVLSWTIAHGIEIGCGLLALAIFLIIWLIVDVLAGRDDGFEPIGPPTAAPRHRYAPYDARATRNRVTETLAQTQIM